MASLLYPQSMAMQVMTDSSAGQSWISRYRGGWPAVFRYAVLSTLLLMHSGLVSGQELSDRSKGLTVGIDHHDGGKTGKRHMRRLLATLGEAGCKVRMHDPSVNTQPALLFDSRPASVVKEQRPGYRSIARAKTLDGALSVRGAILVHASTGINDLASLQGEWVSFVSKNSWPGYRLPLKRLQAAGVDESRNHFYFVGNHVGALSALLHNDVHVAVIAEPLAQRWAGQNSLSILAVSEEAETGGWWMHGDVSEGDVQQCAQALTRLERASLKALPAWIGGFVISE